MPVTFTLPTPLATASQRSSLKSSEQRPPSKALAFGLGTGLPMPLSQDALQFGTGLPDDEAHPTHGSEDHYPQLASTLAHRIEKQPRIDLARDNEKEYQRLKSLLHQHTNVDLSPNLDANASQLFKDQKLVRTLMSRALKMSFQGLEQVRPYQEAHKLWQDVPLAKQRKNHWGAVGILEGTKNGKKVQYLLDSFNWFVPTGFGHVVDTVCSEKQLLLKATQLIHDQNLEAPEFLAMGFINNSFDDFPSKEVMPSDMTPCGKCLNDFQSLMVPKHITLEDHEGDDHVSDSSNHLRIKPNMPFIYMRRNDANDPTPYSLTVVPLTDFGKNLGQRIDSRFVGAVDMDNVAVKSSRHSNAELQLMLEGTLGKHMSKEETRKKINDLYALLPSVFNQSKAIYDRKKLRDSTKDPVVAFIISLERRGERNVWAVNHNTLYSPKTRHFYYPELRAAARTPSPITVVGYYGQNVPLNPETFEILMNKHNTVDNPMRATLQNNQIVLDSVLEELPRLYISAG